MITGCVKLVEPPAGRAVAAAVKELAAIGALKLGDCEKGHGNGQGDEDEVDDAKKGAGNDKTKRNFEKLTALGASLTQLPVDCRLGKLLLLGVSLGCVDEALTAAAALSSRSPFLCPPDAREKADASKRAFARDAAPSLISKPITNTAITNSSSSSSLGESVTNNTDKDDTGCGRMASDVLAAVQAYNDFDALGGGNNSDKGCGFARERLLSIKTLQQMGTLKRQLLEALSSAGLRGNVVPPGLRQNYLEYLGRRRGGSDGCKLALVQWQVDPQRLNGGGGGDRVSSSRNGKKQCGDWTCPKCKSNVFASKSTCFRCREPRPKVEKAATAAAAAAKAAAKAAAAEEESSSPPAPSAELLAALVGAALFPQVGSHEWWAKAARSRK
jgi:hypothetical protein